MLARGDLELNSENDVLAEQERDTALAAFGLYLEGGAAVYAKPVFYLWPELVPALNLWFAVQTQWRHAGMSGQPTGLDYAGVQAVIAQRGGTPQRRKRCFDDMLTMERGALDGWAEKRAKG